MTREDIMRQALEELNKKDCLCLELATGAGKTRIALACINKICDDVVVSHEREASILILVAKTVHKDEWQREMEKWGGLRTNDVTIECYESLKKYAGKKYDAVIGDECFRSDVEVLTDKGYKRFDTLDGSELIAQFTNDSNIEFVKPLRFIKREHHGEMIDMHLGRNRHVYLTPNHEQVYKTSYVKEWRKRPVKDFTRSNKVKIPVSGMGTGDNKPLTNLERVLIAIQADGTLQRHQLKESVYSIQLTKGRKCNRFKSLINGLDIHEIAHKKPARVRYLCKLPKGDAKLLSTHFDINMGYDRACQFIDEVVEWDGYRRSNNYVYYSSIVKENADFVSAVAVQAGYKVLQSVEHDNRKSTYNDVHRVYMRKRSDTGTQPMYKKVYDYNGLVYCVEVPSHMIVVRSEGYVFISGNCHHLSEARRDVLSSISFNKMVLLSATMPKELKEWLKWRWSTSILTLDLPDAIKEEILPEPIIWLMPMYFDSGITEKIVKNGGRGLPVRDVHWNQRWSWIKRRDAEVHIWCTKAQYLEDLDSQIEWFKSKAMSGAEWARFRWLRLCKDRLEWLSSCKNPLLSALLRKLNSNRTITFCSTIEQAELLGKYCIHSKNGLSQKILNAFNDRVIDHITAVNILNEGVNITDCQVGVFANVTASEIITKQRSGRLLRHKHPVMIMPYYKSTREEELVRKHLQGYNPELIRYAHSINDIELQ